MNHNTTDRHMTYHFYPHGGSNLYKPLCPLHSIVVHVREHPYSQIYSETMTPMDPSVVHAPAPSSDLFPQHTHNLWDWSGFPSMDPDVVLTACVTRREEPHRATPTILPRFPPARRTALVVLPLLEHHAPPPRSLPLAGVRGPLCSLMVFSLAL
jgi:hypothetical protein